MSLKPGSSLVIQGLEHRYEDRTVLALPEYRVDAGEHHLILGPSGSGKTTFLHVIAGLLNPSSGSVHIDEQSLYSMTETGRDRFRGSHMGIVFQRLHLIPSLTVTANVLLAQYLAKVPQEKERVRALLGSLGLGHRLEAYPGQLSLGEAQRVAIARALINQPRLLLADEPTSSLDDANAATVIGLLRQQASEIGATLLVVTHDARIQSYFGKRLMLESLA